MAVIRIFCPETWWEQCKWINENCTSAVDKTEWAAWQIGIDDIFFHVNNEDAIVFKLIWGNKSNSVEA